MLYKVILRLVYDDGCKCTLVYMQSNDLEYLRTALPKVNEEVIAVIGHCKATLSADNLRCYELELVDGNMRTIDIKARALSNIEATAIEVKVDRLTNFISTNFIKATTGCC